MGQDANDRRRKEHSYTVNVRWTGNLGQGTANYRGYKRDHEISAPGKPPLPPRPTLTFAAMDAL